MTPGDVWLCAIFSIALAVSDGLTVTGRVQCLVLLATMSLRVAWTRWRYQGMP